MADKIDTLRDGQWHWVPSAPEDGLKADIKSLLRVHEIPSRLGYYPSEREREGLEVEYTPTVDDFVYMGMDMYASSGTVEHLGKSALAVVMPWPMPEFFSLDNKDNHWFMRLWTPGEETAGHFHFPAFFIIEQNTLRELASA